METKKENLPILEQVIGKLEKEQKKERRFNRLSKTIYIIVISLWSIYICNLIYLAFVNEAGINLWSSSSFQTVYSCSLITMLASFYMKKIIRKKKQKFLIALKELKKYLEEGVLPVAEIVSAEEKLGSIKIGVSEREKILKVMELFAEKSDNIINFREKVSKEISSLSKEEKKNYEKKLHSLEVDLFPF